MKNKLFKNKDLCLILGLFLLLLAGCDDKLDGELDMETGISMFSYPSPDGDILAILVGSKVKGGDLPAVTETEPILLKLSENSLLKDYQQVKDWVFRDMAWNPAHGDQLYFMVYENLYDSGTGSFFDLFTSEDFWRGTGRLSVIEVDFTNNHISTVSQNTYPNISLCFRWSPDGKTLAGLAKKTKGKSTYSGELTVSYDGGRTCESTGISMHGHPVWINNKELYLHKDEGSTILKVFCEDHDFKITETLEKDYDRLLQGSFQEKPVYIAWPRRDDKGKSLDKSRRLFVGDKLICEAEKIPFLVFVFTDNIVVEAEDKVLIFDKNLSLCHERRLGRKMHVLNFQPKTNTVFLVKDWKTILCYDFTKDEKPHVLFSVDMLEENSLVNGEKINDG